MRSVLDDFTASLEAVGGRTKISHGAGEAAEAVLDICRAKELKRAVLSSGSLLENVGLRSVLERNGLEVKKPSIMSKNDSLDALTKADVGITDAAGGVARTGTLVLVSATEADRLVSSLPRTHIALLPAENLVASISDIPRLLGQSGTSDPAAVSLVTGPSSTADIEEILVRGVHGPHSVWAVVITK